MQYRLWYIPQLGCGGLYTREFSSLVQAALVLDTIYEVALWEHEHHIKPDYSNLGGIQCFVESDQEWWDIDPEELQDPEVQEMHALNIDTASRVAEILR